MSFQKLNETYNIKVKEINNNINKKQQNLYYKKIFIECILNTYNKNKSNNFYYIKNLIKLMVSLYNNKEIYDKVIKDIIGKSRKKDELIEIIQYKTSKLNEIERKMKKNNINNSRYNLFSDESSNQINLNIHSQQYFGINNEINNNFNNQDKAKSFLENNNNNNSNNNIFSKNNINNNYYFNNEYMSNMDNYYIKKNIMNLILNQTVKLIIKLIILKKEI